MPMRLQRPRPPLQSRARRAENGLPTDSEGRTKTARAPERTTGARAVPPSRLAIRLLPHITCASGRRQPEPAAPAAVETRLPAQFTRSTCCTGVQLYLSVQSL